MTEATEAEPSPDQRSASPAKAVLARLGGPSGTVSFAAPIIVFVVASGLSPLWFAVIASVMTSLLAAGWRLIRREPPRHAILGLALVVISAVVAATTGEARGFFLLVVIWMGVMSVALLGSVVARRPLIGTFFHRVAGGSPGWHEDRRLMRFYSVLTLLWTVVIAGKFALHAWLYVANAPAWLAFANIVSTVLTAVLVVGTIALVRRTVRATPANLQYTSRT
jgi:formate hydrogenlyase subunit 3/multisubunit Na+/H+ antiporter MnhD subunit